MTIIATAIDLAKNVLAVHRANQGGSVQLRQTKKPLTTRLGLKWRRAAPVPLGLAC